LPTAHARQRFRHRSIGILWHPYHSGEDRVSNRNSESPLRIRLSDDRRARLIRTIRQHFLDEFELDEPISDFRAEGLLDFFIRELGPPIYNQGVRDACGYMQEKLGDLEGDVFETERR
jgi:uncharacterized protein (DUF2164 family)